MTRAPAFLSVAAIGDLREVHRPNSSHEYPDLALPAVIGAKLCVSRDAESGVVSPDSLNPTKFFAAMEARGVPFEFEENITELAD